MVELFRRVKWKVLSILVVFLITVGALLGIYRAKDNKIAERLHQDEIFETARKTHSKKLLRVNTRLGEDLLSYDRWVVVATDGDESMACAIVDASIDSGWKPILIGNASCCQKLPCVNFDDVRIQNAPFEIVQYLKSDSRLVRRNVAYLHAIQHGARHIFDAYHHNYRKANISTNGLKKEMQRHLHNVTLAVSIGLVAERPFLKRVSNPYNHFGRPDMWAAGFKRTHTRDSNNFMYHICEARPPSIEKFLEVDDGFFDYAAPPLTIPGTTLAPFLSRNVLYNAEAFWGLPFLPGNDSYSDHLLLDHPHLARSLWNQALLGDIAGSIKLSLSTLPTLINFERSGDGRGQFYDVEAYSSFLLKHSCSTRSILKCTSDMVEDMMHRGFMSQNDLNFLNAWTNDLRRLRYHEPPIITRRRGALNPCIGADGLFGVSFHPALAPIPLNTERQARKSQTLQQVLVEEAEYDYQKNKYLEHLQKKVNDSATGDFKFDVMSEKYAEESRYGKSLEPLGDKKKNYTHEQELFLVKETADSICPGYSNFISSDTPGCANILLVVAMSSPHYDVIPLLEVVYRQHFKNVLFCGPPHESFEIYKKKFQSQEGRTVSFLPSHTKYTYECLMGALEMGYRVDGYMLATDETLINHMQIKNLNLSRIWYGGDHVTKVTGKEWRGLDPGAQKLPRSIEGLHRVLAFLKKTVLGDGKAEILAEYDHRQRRDVNPEESTIARNYPANANDSPQNTDDSIESGDKEMAAATDIREASERSHVETNPADLEEATEADADVIQVIREEIKVAHSARAQPLIASLDKHTVVEQLTLDVSEDDATSTHSLDVKVPLSSEHADPLNILPKKTLKVDSEGQAVETENDNDGTNDPQFNLSNSSVSIPADLLTPPPSDVHAVNSTIVNESSDEVTESSQEEESDEEETKNYAEVLHQLLVASRNDGADEIVNPPSQSLPTQNNTPITEPGRTSTAESIVPSTSEATEELHRLSLEAKEIFDPFDDDWNVVNVTISKTEEEAANADISTEMEEEEVPVEHHWHHMAPLVVTNSKPVEDHSESPELNISSTVKVNTTKFDTTEDQVHHDSRTLPVTEVFTNPETVKISEEEERNVKIDELLEEITKLYSVVQENIQAHMPNSKSGTGPLGYVYGDQSSYRIDPQEFSHFQCDKGTNIEFCKVAADFLYSLSQNIGKDFKLFYDKVPLFYIPNRHVLKFYLLSNLMLQNGITDEIAIPMMLRGLGTQDHWVKLERVNFSYKTVTDPRVSTRPSEAAYLYPVDFHAAYSDWRYQKPLCLKFLNHVLNS